MKSIKIHGVDMTYIPRSFQNEDEVLGDAARLPFDDARQIEAGCGKL